MPASSSAKMCRFRTLSMRSSVLMKSDWAILKLATASEEEVGEEGDGAESSGGGLAMQRRARLVWRRRDVMS